MSRTLFADGMVFDGTGSAPQRGDVVIADGRILDVGRGLDADEQVDCSGRTLLPGLFDCHVHLLVNGLDPAGWRHRPFSLGFFEAVRSMQATLDVGVTTVREAGGADLGMQRAQERGLVAGPRMQLSISMLSQTGGHADPWEPSGATSPIFPAHPGRPLAIADGPDEVRRAARELVRAGANVLKVATTGGVVSPRDDPRHAHFRTDELDVIVAEATAAGITVMAHADGAAGIAAAVTAGVRSIEHGSYLEDATIEVMRKRGTWLVPTLMATRAAASADVGLPASILDKAQMLAAVHTDATRRAIEAGVRIAMGTDSGVTPHGANLTELSLLVEAGMSPAAALHSATMSAAELLGLDAELGSITPGKRADLVIVEGDPLDVATLAQRVLLVYQDGRLVTDHREPTGVAA